MSTIYLGFIISSREKTSLLLKEDCVRWINKILGFNLSVNDLSASPKGKPFFPDQPHIHCSFSHSQDLGVWAWGPWALGVDVEHHKISRDYMGIAESYFPQEDLELLKASAQPREVFYRIWTHKEAYLKARGLTLSDLSKIPGTKTSQPETRSWHLITPNRDIFSLSLNTPQISRERAHTQFSPLPPGWEIFPDHRSG